MLAAGLVSFTSATDCSNATVCAVSPALFSDNISLTEPPSVTKKPAFSNESSIADSHSNRSVCIMYFYSDSCMHCKNTFNYLNILKKKYGQNISIHKYEVGPTHPLNQSLYFKFCQSVGYSGGSIPLIAIGNNYYIGEDEIKQHLESDIETMLKNGNFNCPEGAYLCRSASSYPDSEPLLPETIEKILNISPFLVAVVLGLTDGINPCAFAVLLFIMVFLQEISSDKKRMVKVTTAYILAVLTVNIMLGLVYYFFTISIGYPALVRALAGGLAIIAGLINIKDFFYYGKGFSLQIPSSSKKHIELLVKKANVPAALVLGGLVAVLEAGCSVPIYLTVIEILKTRTAGFLMIFPYILLYNIMFVLPLVILALLIYYGREVSHFETWRESNKRYMRLFLGLVLVLVGTVLILTVV